MRIRGGIAALLYLGAVLGGGAQARAAQTDEFSLQPFPLVSGGVERRTFFASVAAGGESRDSILLMNRTRRTLKLAVYAADARRDAAGRYQVGLRRQEPAGVAAWIGMPFQTLSLPPHASQVIEFVLRPRGTTANPTEAAIVVEPFADAGAGATFVKRVAILVRTDALLGPAPRSGSAVVPASDAPPSSRPAAEGPGRPSRSASRSWMPWLLAPLPLIAFPFFFLIWKRRRKDKEEEPNLVVQITPLAPHRTPPPRAQTRPVRRGVIPIAAPPMHHSERPRDERPVPLAPIQPVAVARPRRK